MLYKPRRTAIPGRVPQGNDYGLMLNVADSRLWIRVGERVVELEPININDKKEFLVQLYEKGFELTSPVVPSKKKTFIDWIFGR